jgi:hypothetical protein
VMSIVRLTRVIDKCRLWLSPVDCCDAKMRVVNWTDPPYMTMHVHQVHKKHILQYGHK